MSGGVAFNCTTARTRLSSGEPMTATSPLRACSIADCGGGSTPNPSMAPVPATTCPVTGSKMIASVRPRSTVWVCSTWAKA